jgi:hypothetical protein
LDLLLPLRSLRANAPKGIGCENLSDTGWRLVECFAAAATASATTIDLTTGGSGSGTGALGGTFLASWVDQTSTGAVDPFLASKTAGTSRV